MNARRRHTHALTTSALLVLMAAIWIVLAPTKFGGQASYVMVAGASMEPTLKRGDLVIVREAQSYEVGQIVTYRHPTIGPIIHRIIDRQGSRYTFKGDNNDWVDSYQPTASEIVGAAWIYLPGAANWLLKLRMPAGLALLSITTAVILMMTLSRNSNSTRKQDRKETFVSRSERFASWAENLDGAFFALGAIAFAALLLGLFAFTRPMTVSAPDDIAFEHHGRFNYHAGGPPGVYDGGKLVVGDPVFHQLVPEIGVDFDYQFISRATSELEGSYSMSAVVSDASGWRRRIELIPETGFDGAELEIGSRVDVEQIVGLTQLLQERTGTQRKVFNVDIIPELKIAGTLDGQAFEDQFAPLLSFQLDDLEMYLRGPDPLSGEGDPLAPSSGGFLPRARTEPTTISILGLDLTVESARWTAGLGFGIGLAGIFGLWLAVRGVSQHDRAAEIQIQYGSLLIEVEQLELQPGLKQTDVRSIDDLAKLAERSGGMILHIDRGEEHVYCVKVDEICYRYILLTTDEDADSGRTGDEGEAA
ncbi:MAG: signal peptidase I [Anaerolineales bacterium]